MPDDTKLSVQAQDVLEAWRRRVTGYGVATRTRTASPRCESSSVAGLWS